ncbi:unnamed protein product [Gordionus sp. m RMFG-2023]
MSTVTQIKVFKPVPPDNGSFPLDHNNLCKTYVLEYMLCVSKNDQNTSKCRKEAKNYLECRMKKNLMAKEDWKQLGFPDDIPS